MVCIEETIGPAAGSGLSGRLGSVPYSLSRPGVVVEFFPVSAVARQLSLNIGIPYLHRFQRRRTDSARGLPVAAAAAGQTHWQTGVRVTQAQRDSVRLAT
jgi:hypothetical protein